jgi:hypothetical protein
MGNGTFSHWSRTFFVGGGLFSSRIFSVRVGLFCVRVGLFFDRSRTFFGQRRTFFDRSRTFLAGGGLFLSPTVAEKSPTPAEKSPTAILKRCWTLEYFGELEFSSPFMEQWTLDARGVLSRKHPFHRLFLLCLPLPSSAAYHHNQCNYIYV